MRLMWSVRSLIFFWLIIIFFFCFFVFGILFWPRIVSDLYVYLYPRACNSVSAVRVVGSFLFSRNFFYFFFLFCFLNIYCWDFFRTTTYTYSLRLTKFYYKKADQNVVKYIIFKLNFPTTDDASVS